MHPDAPQPPVPNKPKRRALNAVIRARVPKARRRVFEKIAESRETSISTIVREALIQYAEAHEAAKQPQPAEVAS